MNNYAYILLIIQRLEINICYNVFNGYIGWEYVSLVKIQYNNR